MIEVRVLLDDIDYDSVVELIAPLAAEKLTAKGGVLGLLGRNTENLSGVVRQVLKTMSQEKKDEFLLQLLEEKKDVVVSKANKFAAKKGAGVKVLDISGRRV